MLLLNMTIVHITVLIEETHKRQTIKYNLRKYGKEERTREVIIME